MTNFVQKFQSTDLNAPTNSGQAGALLAVLNACLVDGFNYSGIAITSITRSGTTATVTLTTASDMFKLQTGGYYTVSGCTGGDASLYNGTFAITIASTTTFTYTMGGTPTGSAAGTPVLATALPITSITRSGNVALVNTTVANSSMVTGDYFTIAGAAQTDYNITAAVKVAAAWAISTTYALGDLVTNDSGKLYVCRTAGISAGSGGPTGTSTAITDGTATWDYVAATGNTTKYFTYVVANTPTTPATGTITHYKAGLQWTRPFAAGTNQQSYRSADTGSNQFYLQVNDDAATAGGAKEAAVYGAEVLTANNTANNGGGANTGRFPTAALFTSGLQWPKSDTASSAARTWTLRGDDRTFYYFPNQSAAANGANRNFSGFGHYISFKPGDGFNTFIGGGSSFNTSNASAPQPSSSFTTTTGIYGPRTYLQTGTAVNLGLNTPILALTGAVNVVDLGLWLAPIFVTEGSGSTGVRGRLPGMYYPWTNSASNFTDGDTWTNITNLTGATIEVIAAGSGGSNVLYLQDRFGPWTA
jgi:hypothetical protein